MNSTRILSLGTLVALIVVLPAIATDKEQKPATTYIVEGEGETEREALADAFARAIDKAVGAYVAEERKLEKSGDVFKDIITFSN